MDRVRMDKWLWAARFFKTRALAATACEMGRIESNGVTAKAARDVKVGDRLRIRKEGAEFQVQVLGVSEMRGPASVAQLLYQETEESKELRRLQAEERRGMPYIEPIAEGKPSKRDRREMDKLRRR